jgi:hypothetical protein
MAATVAQDRIDRAIHHASWLGAFAMFAYGAALSFDVLHTIAQAAGLSPVLAWLWPLGFETFMAVAAVAVLAEQRSRPHKTPWYPWVLTALAAGSSIALNFGHPYIPLDPPPRLLVACVYGVPPICAPFAWHLFLLRLAHRRHQDDCEDYQDEGQDTTVRDGQEAEPAVVAEAPAAFPLGVRTASRPASWCGSCSPARPRIGRCPGRTWPTAPAYPAPAPTRCCERSVLGWPPATATSPPSTAPTPRHDRRHLEGATDAGSPSHPCPWHSGSGPPARPRRAWRVGGR